MRIETDQSSKISEDLEREIVTIISIFLMQFRGNVILWQFFSFQQIKHGKFRIKIARQFSSTITGCWNDRETQMQSLLCLSGNEESSWCLVRILLRIDTIENTEKHSLPNVLLQMTQITLNIFIFFFSIVENGEENCTDLIEAHKKCMREQGFNIWNKPNL